jgi:flagellar basal-body rod protein FlgB
MFNRHTDTLSFQSEALKLRAERQRVLASNIANADTPKYQARDMNFAEALREATGESAGSTIAESVRAAGSGAPPPQMAVTAAAHLATAVGTLPAQPNTSVRSELGYGSPSQTSLDANTVDMDRERAAFVDNTVKYEATLRFINSGVRTMLDAIKGQ